MAAENTKCISCTKLFSSGVLVDGFCGWCRKICFICGIRGARCKRGDEIVCKNCKTKVLCIICHCESNTDLCTDCGKRTITFKTILECKEPMRDILASHLRRYCNTEGVEDKNMPVTPRAVQQQASPAPSVQQPQSVQQVQEASPAPSVQQPQQASPIQQPIQNELGSIGSKIISAIKYILTSDGKELKNIDDAPLPASLQAPKRGKNKALSIAVWDKQFGPDARIGKCYVCSKPIKMEDYEMGHIVSAHDGGTKTIDNLLPVCKNCNRSCGTQNLHAFKAKMGM